MNQIANCLLQSKAVHIEPKEENFFTWTSGKKSPIYCDNRTLISYPEYRKIVIDSFVKLIKEKYTDVELIAGTATAGIPWASWISHELNLPMVYIRSKPKGHGLKSAIEGRFEKGQKTLIIEDLISTGKSSIEALNHANTDGLKTMAVLSIFNYDFNLSKENFKNAHAKYESLCELSEILSHAQSENLLSNSDVQTVTNWSKEFK